MGSIALRRTKSLQVNGQPLVALPPKTLHLVSVQLDADSQDKYDRWQAAGEGREGGGSRGWGSGRLRHRPCHLCCLSLDCALLTAILAVPYLLQGARSSSATLPTTRCCKTTLRCWRSCFACARCGWRAVHAVHSMQSAVPQPASWG
jgi:hypothetical protein